MKHTLQFYASEWILDSKMGWDGIVNEARAVTEIPIFHHQLFMR